MSPVLKKITLILTGTVIICVITALVLVQSPKSNLPAGKAGQQKTINNKILSKEVAAYAQVGGYTLNRLSGYTSPFAEVQLMTVGLARKTLADATGYFLFTNIPVLPSFNELCLVSQDINLLPSFPTCLAPSPSDQNIDIIDILLSPSLAIDSTVVSAASTVVASGMTFPDSPVNVYLYSQNETIFYYFSRWLSNREYRWPWSVVKNQLVTTSDEANFILKAIGYYLTPVKSAFAFGLPKYETKSNANGYFEFSLPGPDSSYNRFYVAAALNVGGKQRDKENMGEMGDKGTTTPQKAKNNKQQTTPTFLPKTNLSAQAVTDGTLDTDLRDSPKSNTLYFRSLGWAESLINRLLTAVNFFINNITNPLGVILIEIMIVMVLLTVALYSRLNKDTIC